MENKNRRISFGLISVILVVSIMFGIFAFINRGNQKTYEEKVIAFENENKSLQKGQIVFVGDSITAGYRLKIYYNHSDCEMYNRGISGDTTDWMITRLQVSVLDLEPSKIVLMIGTNDINGGKSPEEIAQNYERILNMIASALPNTEVWCMSIIPQNEKFSENAGENNRKIQETNGLIESLSLSMGYSYVNLYDRLTDDDGLLRRMYSTDGLHLGFIGYMVWTSVMKEVFD